jgi:hypothetical protein
MSFEQEKQMGPGTVRGVDQLGLCYTCNTVKTCTGRKTWVGPVLHCEEFSDFDGSLTQPVPAAAPTSVGTTGSTEQAASPRTGLCVNCAHRDDCGFPAAEGGTWHCEEYE